MKKIQGEMRWGRHVARIFEMRHAYTLLDRKVAGRSPFEVSSVGARIILK
jgi:hypothetical protein